MSRQATEEEEEEEVQAVLQRQPAEEEEEEEVQAVLQRQPAEEEEEEEEEKVQARRAPDLRADRPLGEEDPALRADLSRSTDAGAAGARAGGSPGRHAAAGSVLSGLARLRRTGRHLSDSTRAFFEPRFGVGFDGVRIHADREADRLARTVKARAFTVGRHIVFRAGEYRPASEGGRRLLAHELTHTLQQGAVARSPDRSEPGPGGEPPAIDSISRRHRTTGVVQRSVTNLAVAGATAEARHPGHFVVARGAAPVTATATTSAPGQVVRWTGGRRQPGNPLQRRVPVRRARTVVVGADTPASPGSRSVTVHVVNGRTAPANTPARLRFSRQRGNPPGLAPFGLTDINTNNPTARIRAFLSGNQWLFRVQRIRHRYLLGVASGGNTDIPNAASAMGPNHCRVITDLTPPAPGTPSGPPRANFWSRRITTAHEFAHVARFYSPPFWEAFMRVAEGAIESAASNVNVDHTVPATLSARAVVRANAAAHQAIINAQHAAADAAEIVGAELFAHGQSNPMYTTLIGEIAARARPLAPTALAAVALGPASVQLNWTDNACNETEYRVFRRRRGGRFRQIATLPAASVAFTDTLPGLVTRTNYTYYVVAAGVAGPSRRSNRVAVTTL